MILDGRLRMVNQRPEVMLKLLMFYQRTTIGTHLVVWIGFLIGCLLANLKASIWFEVMETKPMDVLTLVVLAVSLAQLLL